MPSYSSRLLLFLCLLLSASALTAQTKKGYKLIKKRKPEKAELAFQKAIDNPKSPGDRFAAEVGLLSMQPPTITEASIQSRLAAVVSLKKDYEALGAEDRAYLTKKFRIGAKKLPVLLKNWSRRTVRELKRVKELEAFDHNYAVALPLLNTQPGIDTTLRDHRRNLLDQRIDKFLESLRSANSITELNERNQAIDDDYPKERYSQDRREKVLLTRARLLFSYDLPYDELTLFKDEYLGRVPNLDERYRSDFNIYVRNAYLRDRQTINMSELVADHPDHWIAADCYIEEFNAAAKSNRLDDMLDFIGKYPFCALDQLVIGVFSNEIEARREEPRIKPFYEELVMSWALQQQDTSEAIYQTLLLKLPEMAPAPRGYYYLRKAIHLYQTERLWSRIDGLFAVTRGRYQNDPEECLFGGLVSASRREQWFGVADPIYARPAEGVIPMAIPGLSSADYDETAPVVTADGQGMYFARKTRGGRSGTDIYFSRRENGKWSAPQKAKALSSKEYDKPIAITADGLGLLITRNGRLLYCKRTVTGWSKPQPLPGIEEDCYVGSGCFSRNGEVLLLEARFKLPDLSYSSSAIYQVEPDNNGEYTMKRLKINDDYYRLRTPYLALDDRTFYFSALSKNSLGGHDVFKTRRIGTGWSNWSEPVNLGKEVNTTREDFGYSASGSLDGETITFSTQSLSNFADGNIYSMKVPKIARSTPQLLVGLKPELPDSLAPAILEGLCVEIRNGAGEVIEEARIGPDGQIVGLFDADLENVTFTIKDCAAARRGTAPAILPQTYTIVSDGEAVVAPLEDGDSPGAFQVIQPEPVLLITDLGRENRPIRLAHYYAVNSSDLNLSTGAREQLAVLYDYLRNNNKTLVVTGFADDVGSDAANLSLSERRAESVRSYFITLGLPPDRIRAVGVGSSNFIGDNATAAGRAKNRRTELRIED